MHIIEHIIAFPKALVVNAVKYPTIAPDLPEYSTFGLIVLALNSVLLTKWAEESCFILSV